MRTFHIHALCRYMNGCTHQRDLWRALGLIIGLSFVLLRRGVFDLSLRKQPAAVGPSSIALLVDRWPPTCRAGHRNSWPAFSRLTARLDCRWALQLHSCDLNMCMC